MPIYDALETGQLRLDRSCHDCGREGPTYLCPGTTDAPDEPWWYCWDCLTPMGGETTEEQEQARTEACLHRLAGETRCLHHQDEFHNYADLAIRGGQPWDDCVADLRIALGHAVMARMYSALGYAAEMQLHRS